MGLIEALYNHTWTLTRKTRTGNGHGSFPVTETSVGTVRGRMRPASANERTLAAQRQAEVSHVFYCGADEDVMRDDALSGQGRTWRVVAVRDPSHAGHHLEVDCIEMQKAGQP